MKGKAERRIKKPLMGGGGEKLLLKTLTLTLITRAHSERAAGMEVQGNDGQVLTKGRLTC